MSALTRRRVVAVLIALYFLWPPIHNQLVRVYRVNPWKLAGWAMYTTPNARLRIHLYGIDASEQVVRIERRMTPRLRVSVSEYARRRSTLGLFVQPESIASDLLVALPGYREWTIVVEQIGLTSQNYFGVIHRSQYRYLNVAGELGPVEVHSQVDPDRVQGNDNTRGEPRPREGPR